MTRRLYPQARSQSANWIWGCMRPQIRPQVLKKCMLSLPRLDFGIVLLVAYLQYKIDSPCPWGTEKVKKQRTCEWNKIRIKLVNGGNGWRPAERGWLLGRQAGGHCVHSFLYPTLYQQHNYQNNHNQQPTTNTFTTASSTLCTNMSNTELKKMFIHILLMLLALDLFHLLLLLLRRLLYVLQPVGYSYFHHNQLRNNVPSRRRPFHSMTGNYWKQSLNNITAK